MTIFTEQQVEDGALFMDETSNFDLDGDIEGRVLITDVGRDEEEKHETNCQGIHTSDDWPDESAGPPPPATAAEATKFLVEFFGNNTEGFLSYHQGGPIPPKELVEARNVEMVLRLDLSNCIQFFYEGLDEVTYGLQDKEILAFVNLGVKKEEAAQLRKRLKKDGGKGKDEIKVACYDVMTVTERLEYKSLKDRRDRQHMELFFKLQRHALSVGVPKHHSGGLLLVYLRLCMGVDV